MQESRFNTSHMLICLSASRQHTAASNNTWQGPRGLCPAALHHHNGCCFVGLIVLLEGALLPHYCSCVTEGTTKYHSYSECSYLHAFAPLHAKTTQQREMSPHVSVALNVIKAFPKCPLQLDKTWFGGYCMSKQTSKIQSSSCST